MYIAKKINSMMINRHTAATAPIITGKGDDVSSSSSSLAITVQQVLFITPNIYDITVYQKVVIIHLYCNSLSSMEQQ